MARLKHQVTGEGFDKDPFIAKKDAEDDYKDQLESIGKVFWDTLVIIDEKKTIDSNEDYEESITYIITVEAEIEDFTGVSSSSNIGTNNNLPQDAPIDGSFEAEDTYIVPDEKPKIIDTPKEANKKTEEETIKKEQQQTVTDVAKPNPEITENNTPPELKPQGQEKLAIILNKKRSEIKRVLLPLIINLATGLGIKYLGNKINGAVDISPSCPSPDKLKKLVDKRNDIVDYLNKITRIIDTLSKVLTGVGVLIGITKTIIKTASASSSVQKIAATTVPVPQNLPDPGNSLLVSADNTKIGAEKATKTLDKLSGISISLGLALSLINSVLLGVISLLKSIDAKLVQCGQDPTQLLALSPTLLELERVNTQVEDNNNEITYNGFILEIVEEPYTPTVNRRKGVAKNSQNIILLETPLSFTTNNQVLIEQLKLLIDENNLKAD